MEHRFSTRRFTDHLLSSIDGLGEEEQQNALKLQEVLEQKPAFANITKSGWLFLVTELLLAGLSKKILLENNNEYLAAQKGLLVKDTKRTFVHYWALNLLIGIILGVVADCWTGKKFVMMSVVSLNIVFYFVIVMSDIWPSGNAGVNWKLQLYFHSVFYSMLGVYGAAMYESLASEDYNLLFTYCCLKLVFSCAGRILFVVTYTLTLSAIHEHIIMNFVCFIIFIIVFFIWMLFIDSLTDSHRVGFFKILVHMGSILLWKIQRRPDLAWAELDNGTRGHHSKETRNHFDSSRKLLHFFLLIIPLLSSGFVTQSATHVFRDIFRRLETWEWHTINAFEVTHCFSLLTSVPLIEFVIIPILGKMFRRKITFVFRLLASMVLGCATYLYGIYIMKMILNETPGIPTSWTSEVRFINGLDENVTLRPVEKMYDTAVLYPKSVKIMTYIRPYAGMPIKSVLQLELQTNFKYVATISLEQESCVTYFISDFMEIRRVPGTDPIFYGPPGTNDPVNSRVYFANLDSELLIKLILTFYHSKYGSNPNVDNTIIIPVSAGKKQVFQIFPGTYILTIEHTDVVKKYTFGAGGVYGIIYLPEVKESTAKYMVVQILPPSSLSALYGIVFEWLAWSSYAFVIIIMDIFVFLKSPQTLRAFTFSIYKFIETGFYAELHNIATEVLDFHQIGLYTLILTGTIYLVLCVISGFIILKNRKFFRLKTTRDQI